MLTFASRFPFLLSSYDSGVTTYNQYQDFIVNVMSPTDAYDPVCMHSQFDEAMYGECVDSRKTMPKIERLLVASRITSGPKSSF